MEVQRIAQLNTDEKYKRVLDLYKEYRARIAAEQGYFFQRFSMLLTSQGFLLAAYGVTLSNLDRLKGLAIQLPSTLAVVALVVGLALIRALRGSREAIDWLVSEFRGAGTSGSTENIEAVGLAYRLPPIVLDASVRRMGDAVGVYPWLLIVLWTFLLVAAVTRA
jgi:hypothetical protein